VLRGHLFACVEGQLWFAQATWGGLGCWAAYCKDRQNKADIRYGGSWIASQPLHWDSREPSPSLQTANRIHKERIQLGTATRSVQQLLLCVSRAGNWPRGLCSTISIAPERQLAESEHCMRGTTPDHSRHISICPDWGLGACRGALAAECAVSFTHCHGH
jgi:hypothetical protein